MDWEEIGEALDCLDFKDDDEIRAVNLYARRPNSNRRTKTFQPLSNRNQKFTAHLQPQPLHEANSGKTSDRERCHRVTVEQAIYPRSRMVLFKMLNCAVFDDINGCISTGEQTNVYHASKHDGQEFAVKVFMDRDNSFRHAYCKHNSRKMVKIWAEYEMRNLMRLKAAGIRCPTPILLRLHVLVMEFIGKSGRAAPRLKDVILSKDEMRECYLQMIMVMRNLYQKCKMVHGDLREDNILYYEGNLHIINVSRSVDLDHPLALEFLHQDCNLVFDFFRKNSVGVLSIRKMLDIIVDSSLTDESVDCYLHELDIPWIEMDFLVDFLGGGRRINGPGQLPNNSGIEFGTDENDKEVDSDDCCDIKGVEPEDTTQETQDANKKAARKENKKKVKEEKREARKSKMAKHVKKKMEKQSEKHQKLSDMYP